MFFNVYKIAPQVKYVYGVALVAARSKNEAIETFCETEYRKHQYSEFTCSCEIIPNMNYETKEAVTILNSIHDE